jgi:hypothetical protein
MFTQTAVVTLIAVQTLFLFGGDGHALSIQ